MKIVINLKTADSLMPDFLRPDGAPIPAVGDAVLVRHQGRPFAFRVDSRFLAPGTDIHGQAATVVQLGIAVQDQPQDE